MSLLKQTFFFGLLGLFVTFAAHAADYGADRAWAFHDYWVMQEFLFKAVILIPAFTSLPWLWAQLQKVITRLKQKSVHKQLIELKHLKDQGIYDAQEYERAASKLKSQL